MQALFHGITIAAASGLLFGMAFKPDIAEGLYRNVLKSQPNDPATLNNLAWILGRKGDAEALKFG